MPTVNKMLADQLVKSKGWYEDDPRVERIIEYTDMGGKLAYGLEYVGQEGKYKESSYIRNPTVYWKAGQ